MLIQKLRLQRGWSQAQLAEMSGLSVRTIQRLENGQTASAETLKSLAAVFEVDFSTLLEQTTMSAIPSSTFPMPDLSEPLAPELSSSSVKISLAEEEAMRYVRKLRKFYSFLLVYVVILSLSGLYALWTQKTPYGLLWPAGILGFILLVKAIRLFGLNWFLGSDWERKVVKKRLGRKL